MLNLISWKQPFEMLNQEYETTREKKEALENLLDSGRISQSTFDSFIEKLEAAIQDIRKRKKDLLNKMSSEAEDLEDHIKTLETILANFEIRHVTGEVEEDVYQREVELLSTGIDVTRQELNSVEEAVDQISESLQIPTSSEGSEEGEGTVDVEAPISEVEEVERTPEEVVKENLPEPPAAYTGETHAEQEGEGAMEKEIETTTEEDGGEKETESWQTIEDEQGEVEKFNDPHSSWD
ncbi:MAG: CdvA-like protein [Thermoproteota archaeon]